MAWPKVDLARRDRFFDLSGLAPLVFLPVFAQQIHRGFVALLVCGKRFCRQYKELANGFALAADALWAWIPVDLSRISYLFSIGKKGLSSQIELFEETWRGLEEAKWPNSLVKSFQVPDVRAAKNR